MVNYKNMSLRTFFTAGDLIEICYSFYTVKPVLSSQSKIDKTKVFKTDYPLMQVLSIAECFPLEHSEILLTCIKETNI